MSATDKQTNLTAEEVIFKHGCYNCGHVRLNKTCNVYCQLRSEGGRCEAYNSWTPLPEPCTDAVSREEARNLFKSLDRWNINKDEKKNVGLLYDDVMFGLDNLPPVTPKQQWIPVDYDRYPETYPNPFQEVWITDGYGEVKHEAYGGTRNIKAWMPYVIPEPYKEESEVTS